MIVERFLCQGGIGTVPTFHFGRQAGNSFHKNMGFINRVDGGKIKV